MFQQPTYLHLHITVHVEVLEEELVFQIEKVCPYLQKLRYFLLPFEVYCLILIYYLHRCVCKLKYVVGWDQDPKHDN